MSTPTPSYGTRAAGPRGRSEQTGMLEDPSLSRQWVARRLQRALTVERWCGPARGGLARSGGHLGRVLRSQAEASERRAQLVEALIDKVGAVPYPSQGIAAPLTRAATTIVAKVSGALTTRLARLIAEHTLSEYRSLVAFVQDAPGVPSDLVDEVAPIHAEAAAELAALTSSWSP